LAVLPVAVLALGAAFTSGCGDDDDDDNGGAATVPAAQTPSGSATEPADEPTEPAAEPTAPAAGGDTVSTAESDLGTILVDAEGMTLYTFANDTAGSGESACIGSPCEPAWPPLTTAGEPTAGDDVTGELGTIERPDGSMQVTYDGLPLYFFAGDGAPGDTNGEGVGGVWTVAKP
jgi:predicted lipoprotein with Yx(FWY)xxD motif